MSLRPGPLYTPTSFLFPSCLECPMASEQLIMILPHSDLPDAKSRALDNIGRVFARVGKFQQAIDTWEEKIPLAKTTLEKTWLFHEIGRCYLELDQAEQAQNYGEKSQQCAEEEGDIEWQLNASVLVAQAQVKLRNFESAVNNFEKALERAKLVHNNEAQHAIISALDDANKGIIDELKKTNYRDIFKEKKEKEEAAALDKAKAAAKGKERVRRVRDEHEKIMKHWGREQDGMEKGTDDELSNGESPTLTASGQEEDRKTGVEKNISLRRELGAMGKNSRDVMKRWSGESGKSSGGAGKELSKGESREIYRRPSDLDQKPSEELIKNGSNDKEESLSEAERRESEDLEEIELGETETESAEKMEKDEKEDE
ncbi:Tetratricopeptide repeat protein 25 [Myotis brandtii]|uniref:Outer dynein arm-docking complex subunit 4 n=1 Tax=Myotis brandtii TaxID=109478 RepID=S7PRW8_MYOBR|nr:Tetratricopeptide repeat protein 25 [Myotis brandtii]